MSGAILLSIWPTHGIDRPEGSSPIPENLNWDLWLGVAPERPFVEKVYRPFRAVVFELDRMEVRRDVWIAQRPVQRAAT